MLPCDPFGSPSVNAGCVAYNAVVNNGSIKPGDRVVVFGPGPIGLLCAHVAKLCGAEVAIVGLERDSFGMTIGHGIMVPWFDEPAASFVMMMPPHF